MFEVGDEALYYDNRVIVRDVYRNSIAIEFLQYKDGLHDCTGDVPNGNGWFVAPYQLEQLPTDLNII